MHGRAGQMYIYCMTHIVVTVAEEQAGTVQQWLAEQGIAFAVEEDGIPDWHKEILNERLAKRSPETVISWEQVENRLAKRKREKIQG